MKRPLRPHQIKAKEMLRESLRTGHRAPMLAAPCSFGKTTVASDLFESAKEKGKRCCFIVDRVELIDQASERFTQDGIDHGIIQGDHWMTDYSKPVQVATVQTLAKRKLQDFDFCIIDEAHVLHQTHKKYMETFSNIPFIGLSATPFTKGLGKYFDDLIVPITTQELMDQGYLCEYDAYAPSDPDLAGIRVKRGDYDQAQLSLAVDKPKLVGDIIDTHQNLAKGRPTVVFAVDIKHSQHICNEFRKRGVVAVHVDCHTDKDTRKLINESFKAGNIDVLSCVAIFEKGWDAPIASCLIQAAPTKSIMRYVQQVGRILRTHPGKDKAIILDHAGNTIRHGWVENITPNSLCAGEKDQEREIIKRDKSKREPIKCGKCGFVKEAFICPACGHKPEYARNVELIDGELEKQSKKKTYSKDEKTQWYAMFLHHARSKNMKDGWAYYQTIQKCGSFIRDRNVTPKPPSEECAKYIKYTQIKNAKGKASHAATA